MKKNFEIERVHDKMTILRIKEKLTAKYGISCEYMAIYTLEKNGRKINELKNDLEIGPQDSKKNQARIIISEKPQLFIDNFNKNIGGSKISVNDEKITLFINSRLYFIEENIPLQRAIKNNKELDELLTTQECLLIKPPQIGGEILDINKSLKAQNINAEMELFTLSNFEKEYEIYCGYFVTETPIKLRLRQSNTILDVKRAFLREFGKEEEKQKQSSFPNVKLDETKLSVFSKPYFLNLIGDLEKKRIKNSKNNNNNSSSNGNDNSNNDNNNNNDGIVNVNTSKEELRLRKQYLANKNNFWQHLKGKEAFRDTSRLANEWSLSNGKIVIFPRFDFNLTVLDERIKYKDNNSKYTITVCSNDEAAVLYQKCHEVIPNSISVNSFELVRRLHVKNKCEDNVNDEQNDDDDDDMEEKENLNLDDEMETVVIENNGTFVEQCGLFENAIISLRSKDESVNITVERSNGVMNEYKFSIRSGDVFCLVLKCVDC